MNAVTQNTQVSQNTMTSLEIVDMINKEREAIAALTGKEQKILQHKDFLKKTRTVLGEEASAKFSAHVQIDVGNGAKRDTPVYVFPKREATLMAMSYSPAISAAVYDKMTALEEVVASQAVAALPNFSNPAEAARAWALEYERSEQLALVVEQKEALLIEQAPKVDYVEKYMEVDGSLGIQAAARVLKCNMRELGHWLVDRKLAFRSQPANTLLPYATSINKGLMLVKVGVKSGGDSSYQQMKITNKGMQYLAENLPTYVYKTHN
jgi:phage antirepressor YoqD-like protein